MQQKRSETSKLNGHIDFLEEKESTVKNSNHEDDEHILVLIKKLAQHAYVGLLEEEHKNSLIDLVRAWLNDTVDLKLNAFTMHIKEQTNLIDNITSDYVGIIENHKKYFVNTIRESISNVSIEPETTNQTGYENGQKLMLKKVCDLLNMLDINN